MNHLTMFVIFFSVFSMVQSNDISELKELDLTSESSFNETEYDTEILTTELSNSCDYLGAINTAYVCMASLVDTISIYTPRFMGHMYSLACCCRYGLNRCMYAAFKHHGCDGSEENLREPREVIQNSTSNTFKEITDVPCSDAPPNEMEVSCSMVLGIFNQAIEFIEKSTRDSNAEIQDYEIALRRLSNPGGESPFMVIEDTEPKDLIKEAIKVMEGDSGTVTISDSEEFFEVGGDVPKGVLHTTESTTVTSESSNDSRLGKSFKEGWLLYQTTAGPKIERFHQYVDYESSSLSYESQTRKPRSVDEEESSTVDNSENYYYDYEAEVSTRNSHEAYTQLDELESRRPKHYDGVDEIAVSTTERSYSDAPEDEISSSSRTPEEYWNDVSNRNSENLEDSSETVSTESPRQTTPGRSARQFFNNQGVVVAPVASPGKAPPTKLPTTTRVPLVNFTFGVLPTLNTSGFNMSNVFNLFNSTVVFPTLPPIPTIKPIRFPPNFNPFTVVASQTSSPKPRTESSGSGESDLMKAIRVLNHGNSLSVTWIRSICTLLFSLTLLYCL